MAESFVIARAFEGEPLKRVALETGNGLVYLAAPEGISAIGAGEAGAVGFPMKDVFEFSESAFATLADQWARQRETDPATWGKLRHYDLRSSGG